MSTPNAPIDDELAAAGLGETTALLLAEIESYLEFFAIVRRPA
jgi:hypothetical protein